VQGTVEAVTALLGGRPTRFAYQSQGRSGEKWLEPTVEHYREEMKYFYFATPLDLEGLIELERLEEILTPEKKLRNRIAQHPAQMEAYVELSQIYINEEQYEEAAKILAQAVEHSNGDVEIREKWEDAQLRHLRQKISRIEDPSERKKQEKTLFEKELEVYKNRCERYPNDALFRFNLGYRYMLLKKYNEAIRELQSARHDPRQKGSCLLALGQCFQQIKQYPLAMDHYEMAIEEIPDRDAANKKKVLYLAGKLALGLKNVERANKHLSVLASLDFTYKDVPTLLDKLAQLRKNGPSDQPDPSEPE
jgi:tetratricopeptide (TPR) repeat protein